jgi:uncharacterized DUF497 family protein
MEMSEENVVQPVKMLFEFDPQKSASNKIKHGIDFVEAQMLWRSRRVELHAKAAAEMRYLVIGTIENVHWSAVITYRGMTIRLISVRKSTPLEVAAYAKIQH